MPRPPRKRPDDPRKSPAAPAKKSQASRTRKSAAADEPKQPGWWSRNPESRKFIFQLAIPLAALVGMLTFGARMAFAYVRTMPQFRVDAGHLVMDNRPPWLKQDAAHSIHMKAFRRQDISIFDPDLVPKVRAEYESDPWVLKVVSISKMFPNQVNVGLVLREPVARVSSELGTYLLDINGVVVDIQNPSHDMNYRHLPIIAGWESEPPLRGKLWDDPSITAALGVSRVLLDEKFTEELAVDQINVSNFKGRKDPRESEIVIHLPAGNQIHWGRGVSTYGEVPLHEKLKKIRECAAKSQGSVNLDWIIRYPDKTLYRSREAVDGALQ
jgi:hypothetical protein